MNFNEKLMELRKEKGWSQETLGNLLEVSRQTVSKWELGQTTPELNKLIELSKVFAISLDDLLNNSLKEPAAQIQYIPYPYHYEYKSKRKIFGIPLVHINLGRGTYRAKGIIAVGNLAAGVISAGLLSTGLISFGILSAGILSLGALVLGGCAIGSIAVGLAAFGGISIGIISVGGLAFGIYSLGGCALAKDIAMGGYASGHIAIGQTTKGIFEFHTYHNFTNFNAVEIKRTILQEFPGIWKPLLYLFTS